MLLLVPFLLLLATASSCSAGLVSRKLQQAPVPAVDLGRASGFSVLAYATITNSGAMKVWGNIGVTPGTAITGEVQISYFPNPAPFGRIGTEDSNVAPANAKLDLTAAYLDASLRVANVQVLKQLDGSTPSVIDLGGRTFYPGLYKHTGDLEVKSGTLYLSGNGVFIFQMEATLVVHTGMKIVLLNGALASNVFWRVADTASFMVGSQVVGTVMALASIDVLAGATITGRLFALNGEVTLLGGTIAFPSPSCLPTEYEVIRAPPTYVRTCMALATCSATEYESVAPKANTNRVCTAIPECPYGKFQTVAPNANTAQVCTDWTTCTETEYESFEPDAFNDRRCSDPANCD